MLLPGNSRSSAGKSKRAARERAVQSFVAGAALLPAWPHVLDLHFLLFSSRIAFWFFVAHSLLIRIPISA